MANQNFEESMRELEEIIKSLEDGNIELNNALELFEKGVVLSKELRETLDKAEQKVTKLTAEATPLEEIFDNPEE